MFEGCRGHLGKQLIEKFKLDENSGTQHYAIGFKELWDVEPENHIPGKVMHTMGWPGNHFGGMFRLYMFILEQSGFRRPYCRPVLLTTCLMSSSASSITRSSPRPSKAAPECHMAPTIVKGGLRALPEHVPAAC